MWDVLSGDFDESLTKEQCLQNVILNAKNGSIIVFHDSEKAFPRLEILFAADIRIFLQKRDIRFERLENFCNVKTKIENNDYL